MAFETALPDMLPIVFGVLLAATHYLAERIDFAQSEDQIASFAAGVSVTYIFIELLPVLAARFNFDTRIEFLPVLAGFAGFHLGEKYIRQHERRDTLHRDLKEWHAFSVGLYYFTVGMVLVGLTRESLVAGTLFFIPIMFNAWASTLSFGQIHRELREQGITLFLVSIAAVLGAGLALTLPIPQTVEFILLGAVVGILFYTVIRDSIPTGTAGRLTWFFSGIALYTAILFIIDLYILNGL